MSDTNVPPRQAAIEAINGADGPARYDGKFAIAAIEAAGLVVATTAPDRDEMVTIRLTEAEAEALYSWTQGHECPNYWETPLDPVGRALALWYREGGYPGWSNR